MKRNEFLAKSVEALSRSVLVPLLSLACMFATWIQTASNGAGSHDSLKAQTEQIGKKW
jgi:hypothetical protein